MTFKGRTAAVTGVSFGCSHNNSSIFKSNETGIVGFSRGFLPLPSQLKVGNFSHCFTTISTVLLGLPANLYNSARGVVQTTCLIRNPSSRSLYYLSLRGITVGSTRLPVPEAAFALRDDGDSGTIIDSGTGMTSPLPEDVYKLLREAFVAQVRLPVYHSPSLSQLCFAAPSSTAKPDVPWLLFHFEGATLDLPRENYMFDVVGAGRSITCLAINDRGDITVIGNNQQQNMHVLYDLASDKLSFVPTM